MVIDPASADPRSIYKILIGAVVPRPIAFVSTLSADGIRNLAPFSFFTVVSADPPVLCFTPMNRGVEADHKDTLRNIEATREFVVNIVSESFAAQMNLCSGEYSPEVDEFEVSGLTPVASDLVKPPRVKESHIQMECRLLQVVPVSAKRLGGSLVLGEVVRFHVDDMVFKNDAVHPSRLRPIGRMGGSSYVRMTDLFDMERPK